MNTSEIRLDVEVTQADADPEQLDQLARQVINDLHDLGAESVERREGDAAPEDAKGDPFTVGALALVTVPAMVPNLVSILQTWAQRGKNRKVKIKTPAGLEVEFMPENKLSETELLAMIEKPSQVQ